MRFVYFLVVCVVILPTSAFSPYKPPGCVENSRSAIAPATPVPTKLLITSPNLAKSALAAVLTVLIASSNPAVAISKTAAQISVNSIPPTSVEINCRDLPVVGDLLSGTYTKVTDQSTISSPSVIIRSPSDKIGAVKDAATGGHFEFDVNGKLTTHLNVDISAPRAGIATIVVKSPVIPPLPFKQSAQFVKDKSDWNVVTNMGNGDTYYYNSATDVATRSRPKGF